MIKTRPDMDKNITIKKRMHSNKSKPRSLQKQTPTKSRCQGQQSKFQKPEWTYRQWTLLVISKTSLLTWCISTYAKNDKSVKI